MALILTLPTAADQSNDEPIDIQADRGRYDAALGATHLSGNIRISHGETVVHADDGHAHQGPGRSYERIELEGARLPGSGIDEEGHEIHGQARRVVLELPSNRLSMIDEVRIERADLVVTADSGRAFQADNRYERVELDGSPSSWEMTLETGERVEGQSERIIYHLVDQQVIMIGNARVTEPRGSFSGQRLLYDLQSQATEGEGGIHMIIEPEARDESRANAGSD
jgi:lipopolysaccharide export system protein LptA